MESLNESKNSSEGLKRFLTPLNVWALSFCCCIGWGSFIMPGATFLPFAGPVGTIIAMVLGATVMIIIAANYHYMIEKYPDEGGVFTYTKKILGYDHALLCAWALWLTYVSIIWANATAFVLVGRNLVGNIMQFGFHYVLFGYDIYFGEIILTLLALFIFGLLNIHKKIFAVKFNTLLGIFFLACGIIFAVVGFSNNGADTFYPAFSQKNSELMGIFSIVALSPWAFVGFEVVSHLAGEFNFKPGKAFSLMTWGIITTAIFYISMTILAASEVPPQFAHWGDYTKNLSKLQGLESVPTFYAVHKLFGDAGIILMAFTILAAISTSLIGLYIGTSRLIYATANDNIISKWFSKLNAQGVPSNAILFLMIISIAVPFVGRNMVSWVVDATTVGATIVYGYTSACSYITAKKESRRIFQYTGAFGVIISAILALFLLFPNVWASDILSTESYFVLVAWSALGFVFFQKVFERDTVQRLGKSVIVWIVMLFFIFFGSLMWVRQETDESMKAVVKNVGEFYQNELESYGIRYHSLKKVQEEYYLKNQMENVRNDLFKSSVIQMSLILMSLFIMFNIYSAILRRGRKSELAKIQAEESSRAKTAFLSNMSHDIRTPMNAIIGYTELSKSMQRVCESCTREKCPDDIPNKVFDFLQKIEASSKHLLSLINDILDMSRIESGKMELDAAPCDITKVLAELYDMFATQMQTKKIKFTVDTSAVQNKFVSCDKHRLNRVLLNLTSNAYKFTPEGGNISITLAEKSAGLYELRVKDSGIGMSPEFAKTVFEPFTRERTSTVSKIQGTGLGMAITKSIVDLMNGSIEVITEQGKGTEFVLNVELPNVDESEIKEETPAIEEAQNLDFTNKKVLLVDDIEVNREIAIMILEEVGFNVDFATNGAEAVEKVKAQNYDVVLMDIQMPIMNGYEATAEIRKLENPALANVPIIAMTANAFSEDVERAKEAGMNDHVAKPLDIPKMMETLQRVLSKNI